MTRIIPAAGSRLLVLAALGAALAGCQTADRTITSTVEPIDYRDRHPIVLRQDARNLDVFVGRGVRTIDERQMADIRAFAAEYRSRGRGGIHVQVPHGHPDEPYARHAAGIVRQVLAGSGSVYVSHYRPHDRGLSAPVRLTFSTLQAKVESRCGLWPDDLGTGPSLTSGKNLPYHNLGCAYQQNIAAQVADPLDLVRPRPEGPVDTIKRTRAIESIRQAKDPSTQYNDKATQINQGVGVK